MKILYIILFTTLFSCSKDKLPNPCNTNQKIGFKNIRTGDIARGYFDYDCNLSQKENFDLLQCDSLILQGIECTILIN